VPSEAAIGRVCLALDVQNTDAAVQLAEHVGDAVGVLKIGLELFVSEGPRVVERLQRLGREIFLDLKLHDIPETVARAVSSAAGLGVRYLTVHAAGARAMLEAASAVAPENMKLLAVSVLTSLDQSDLASIGVAAEPEAQVLRLARLAQSSGVTGLVCSARELVALRTTVGHEFTLVVPGIRPSGATAGDQKRVATPASAIADGASLLVVGRPIRDALDPRAQALAIASEIDAALASSRIN
jgi:orotidine-5'-phosphate decarboxylase